MTLKKRTDLIVNILDLIKNQYGTDYITELYNIINESDLFYELLNDYWYKNCMKNKEHKWRQIK